MANQVSQHVDKTMNKPICGTCPWFEREGSTPNGLCLVEPPIVQVVLQPPSAIGGQPQPKVQGLRPPTSDRHRCSRHPAWQGRPEGRPQDGA